MRKNKTPIHPLAFFQRHLSKLIYRRIAYKVCKLLLVFVFLNFSAPPSFSQITYQNRLEIELKDGYFGEKVIPFGEHGFIMFSQSEDKMNGETEWKYERFNFELESEQIQSIFLSSKLKVEETFNCDKRNYTFLKDRKGKFALLSVDVSTLEITMTEGVLPKKAIIKEMSVLGDLVFLKTIVRNDQFIYRINWKTGEKKLIPITLKGIRPKRTNLMGIQVLKSTNEVFVYAKEMADKRNSDVYLIKFDSTGREAARFKLTGGTENNIIDISASPLEEGAYAFTGTYAKNNSSGSEGLFFCKIKNKEVDFFKFYNFLDLDNFLSYLPEKRIEKIEKKKNRKAERGKELTLTYRIAPHEVMQLPDGYLFLGEAFYPTYQTQTTTSTSTTNGVTSTTTHTTQVFTGYQYTHAILARFGSGGNLLWDEIFELRSAYKPYKIKRFISIEEKNQDMIKMVFASNNKITTKAVDNNGSLISDFQSEEIETNFKGDKAKRSFSDIDYWYDNYFIAYGQQIIKNTADETARKRKVYFISKVRYE